MRFSMSQIERQLNDYIKKVSDNSESEGKSRLSVSEYTLSKHIFWRTLYLVIPFFVFLYFVTSWDFKYWFIAAAFLTGYMLTLSVSVIMQITKHPKSFVHYNNKYFVFVGNGEIALYPLWQFDKVTFNRPDDNGFVLSSFKFGQNSIDFPYLLSKKIKIENFCKNLSKIAYLNKKFIEKESVESRISSGNWQEWKGDDPLSSIPVKEKYDLINDRNLRFLLHKFRVQEYSRKTGRILSPIVHFFKLFRTFKA